MLLAVDVGNTQTTIGLFNGETLKHMWRISSRTTQSSDELHVKLKGLLDIEKVATSDIDGVAMASVVPNAVHMWQKVSKAMFGVNLLLVTARTACDLIDVSLFRNASSIGADRIADAVAAKTFYGSPVIVVDFGTATNMEVIDKDGRFAGGIIAPGLESSMNALFSHAALLPQVGLTDPKTALGRSTNKAMQVGIVYGEVDRVDGLVRRVFAQLGYEAKVVSTGGLANTISKLSSTISEVNRELTLQGIRLIFEHQRH